MFMVSADIQRFRLFSVGLPCKARSGASLDPPEADR